MDGIAFVLVAPELLRPQRLTQVEDIHRLRTKSGSDKREFLRAAQLQVGSYHLAQATVEALVGEYRQHRVALGRGARVFVVGIIMQFIATF